LAIRFIDVVPSMRIHRAHCRYGKVKPPPVGWVAAIAIFVLLEKTIRFG
jgi:hypothetical protein